MLCTIHYLSLIIALFAVVYILASGYLQTQLGFVALLALLVYIATASEPVGCW
jgi:hypothetical protein